MYNRVIKRKWFALVAIALLVAAVVLTGCRGTQGTAFSITGSNTV